MQVTTGDSLSKDYLKELVEKQMHEDDEISVSDDEEQKRSLATITEIMDQFIQNDLNFDRSSKARQSLINTMSCYWQLLAERNRKRQTMQTRGLLMVFNSSAFIDFRLSWLFSKDISLTDAGNGHREIF